MQWLAIALGGAIGSVIRFAAVGYLTPLLNYRFPLGTFVVNIVGSFLIGVAYVLLVEKTTCLLNGGCFLLLEFWAASPLSPRFRWRFYSCGKKGMCLMR